MATYYSDYQTAVRAAVNGSLHTRAKGKQVAQKIQIARFTVTGAGTEAANEWVELGSLNCAKAKVVPELCRIRFGGSGTTNATVKFAKATTVNQWITAGWTRVTTTATVTTAQPHGYTTGQVLTVNASSDVLAIVLGTVTITVTGANTFTFTCLNAGSTSGTLTIGIPAGTSTDLTTAAATTAAAVYVGAAAGIGDLVQVDKTDMLRLTYTAVTTPPPVTRVLYVEVAYFDET
jgi:hypothetical protein